MGFAHTFKISQSSTEPIAMIVRGYTLEKGDQQKTTLLRRS